MLILEQIMVYAMLLGLLFLKCVDGGSPKL